MRPASYYSARDEHSYVNRNTRIVQLLRFYGAKMCEEVGGLAAIRAWLQ